MTVLSFLCPFEHQGPCFGRVDGRCRILREYDYRWKHCPFQKPRAQTPEMRADDDNVSLQGVTQLHTRAAELLRSGMSTAETAKALGVTQHAVNSWMRKGWI